jgi:hypothetical protein
MIRIVEGPGLCSTCNNAPGCYYNKSRGPALFCELFDDYTPPASLSVRTATTVPAEPSAEPRVAEESGRKHIGLCENCRHQQTCGHPKPLGGVWHCEDYE